MDEVIRWEICQGCSNDKGTEQWHPCPFNEEIWNDSSDVCNCCPDCEYQCAMDI